MSHAHAMYIVQIRMARETIQVHVHYIMYVHMIYVVQ